MPKDTLVGSVDDIDEGLITGWAYDAAHPNRRILLDVFMSGNLIGQAVADREYQGIPKPPGGDGKHGFVFRIPRDLSGIKPTAFTVGFHETGVPLARDRREPDFIPPPEPAPAPQALPGSGGLDIFSRSVEPPPSGSQAEVDWRLQRLEDRMENLSRQIERLTMEMSRPQAAEDEDEDESDSQGQHMLEPPVRPSGLSPGRIMLYFFAVVFAAVLFAGFRIIGNRISALTAAAQNAAEASGPAPVPAPSLSGPAEPLPDAGAPPPPPAPAEDAPLTPFSPAPTQ